jgi:hypothetical protein
MEISEKEHLKLQGTYLHFTPPSMFTVYIQERNFIKVMLNNMTPFSMNIIQQQKCGQQPELPQLDNICGLYTSLLK